MLQNYLDGQPFPTDAQFNSALSLIDFEDVDVSSSLVALEKPGMGVTLDGIATGYILDKSIEILRSNGIKSAFINFGGTLATIGGRSRRQSLAGGNCRSIESSEQHWNSLPEGSGGCNLWRLRGLFYSQQEYLPHHRSLYARSPLFSHSATVVSSTALMAHPLGVALMVEDPNAAINLMDNFPAECLLYTGTSGIMASSGMEQVYEELNRVMKWARECITRRFSNSFTRDPEPESGLYVGAFSAQGPQRL